MRKTYFIFLVVTTITTLIFSLPGVGLVALVYTLGLALLLLGPLPYLLIGLWSVLPAVLFWQRPKLRWSFLVLGMLAAGCIFYAPPYISDQRLTSDLEARAGVAPHPIGITRPIGVEIRRRAASDPDLFVRSGKSGALYGSQPCFELCERLLTGGDVAWVRVILTDDSYGNKRARTHALLVPGRPNECLDLNADAAPGKPCAMFVADHGRESDLTIILDEDRTDWGANHFTPYQPMGYREATGYLGPVSNEHVVFKVSQVFHERPTGRISLDFGNLGNGHSGGGIQLVRARAASEPIDLAATVAALDIELGPVRKLLPKSPKTERNPFIAPPPDSQDAIYAASLVLVGPQLRPPVFSNAFAQVINRWHDRLRWKTILSEADRRIFCDTVRDKRVKNHFWKDQVIRKHRIRCS